MTRKRRIGAVAALATLIAPLPAAAADVACLSRGEAKSLVTYALPQVIDGTGQRCAQALPANAYLRVHGQDLVQRYSGQKDRYWPQARAAFVKLSTAKDAQFGQIAGKLPDESLRPLVDTTVSGLVSQAIPLEACEKIDLAVDLLSPLPPENTAGLIALIVEITAKAGKAVASRPGTPGAPAKGPAFGGLPICKD